jgi:hypothetical protein
MEHSSHAHPLPDGHDVSLRQQSVSAYASCTITSQPASQDEDLSQQSRRLQLRNIGFRGPVLPFRRISPLYGASIEAFRPVSNENSPASARKRSLYGEELPFSPVNILQEIHNSTRKKRAASRPVIPAIFDDNAGNGEVSDDASPTSWYKGGSNDCSPAVTPVNMMKLREGSLNQRTPPPLSSPLAKHVKGQSLNRLDLCSASTEASKYIEHLESQLASANAQLISPTTSKKRAAKLRVLTTENRNLRHEIKDWEKEFDARLQEEKDRRYEIDMEFRSRIRALEDDMELKDARIAELEWELGGMRVKVRDAEGLEEANVSLEKRIDVLTSLLVQSPTTLEAQSTTTSPNKGNRDPLKRTPRPRSMVPRMPSSYGDVRPSLGTVSESTFWHSKSYGPSSSIAETPETHNETILDDRVFQSPTFDEGMRSPDCVRHSRRSSFFDSRSRASTFYRSAPSSASRPNSIRSSGSFGPSSWGLPFPDESVPKSPNRQRKMRRFPSGSSTLRPLILPTAAAVPSLPASAPIYPSIEATARQYISELSLDPTTAFLSRPLDSSPFSHPNQRIRPRSTSEAQEQTLQRLEGKFGDTGRSNGSWASRPTPSVPGEPSIEFAEIPAEKRKRRSRPRSLQKELEQANVEHTEDRDAEAGSPEALEVNMPNADAKDEYGQILIGTDPTPSKLALSNARLRLRRPSKDSDITPKPAKVSPPGTVISPWAKEPRQSTTLAAEHAHGLFSRLISLVSQAKQDPIVLARRLLSNAWALGSKQLGGIGWWLLGLLYHRSKWRERDQAADSGIVEDNSTKDFDWHHFSAEASRSRTAEHYFRDYGGTNKRDTWMSPPHVQRSQIVPPFASSPPSRIQPHLFPCEDCVEPSCRRTLRLWFQFSLGIVLAVGLAVKNGPATLLISQARHQFPPHEQTRLLKQGQRQRQEHAQDILLEHADQTFRRSQSSHESNGMDSGYGSITFAETLGPADFEDR